MISYSYPTGSDEKRVLSLFSVTIRAGEANGPLGGWDTLYRSENDELLMYYYRSVSEEGHYSAIITNKIASYYYPSDRLTFLTVGTVGFEEAEFLSILGSLRSRLAPPED